MIKTKNPGILKAIDELRHFSLNPHLRLRFEAYLKEKRDRIAIEEYIRDEGIAAGIAEGRAVGMTEGMAEGREQGIRFFILDNLEEHKSKEIIIAKLVRHFSLSEEEAEKYYEKYAKINGDY